MKNTRTNRSFSKKLIASIFASAVLALAGCGGDDSSQSAGTGGSIAGQCPTTIPAVSASTETALSQDVQSTRFIVKARPTMTQSVDNINAVQQAFAGAAKVSKFSRKYYTVEFNQNMSSKDVAQFMHNGDYEYIEPDTTLHATMTPNDPSLASQWAHSVVHSKEAWDISKGGDNVTVAVVDSGVDYTHPDLAANIWNNTKETNNGVDNDGNGYPGDIHGWNFVSNNNNPMADDASTYHGTHVSGTIGAVGNNGIGISGHAQQVKIMPLKFLDSSGSGATSNAVKAIDYAIANGAKIISNSWGGSSYSQALSDAIDRARSAGILFVVAAGNNGNNNDTTGFYPASYTQDNMIRVAASDSSDKLASWSNYGAKTVDIAAPGVSIYSTKNGGAYQYLSGTSMATPLISGVLATMVSLRPDLNYLQIKSALLNGVDKVSGMSGKIITGGRVNAYNALNTIKPGTPASQIPSAPSTCASN